MVIRALGPEDLDRHVSLRERLWPDQDPPHGDDLRALLTRPSFTALGAFDGPTLIGFAEATIREYVDGVDGSPAAYLEGIYVDDAHRRKGVATALVDAIAELAARSGCEAVGSDAILEDVESHAWHRSAGFAEIETVVRFSRPAMKAAV